MIVFVDSPRLQGMVQAHARRQPTRSFASTVQRLSEADLVAIDEDDLDFQDGMLIGAALSMGKRVVLVSLGVWRGSGPWLEGVERVTSDAFIRMLR